MRVVDALGRELHFAGPPRRIVSLVPSITETLFALGVGESIVGVTEYCVHPAEALRDKQAVGGTKQPDLERIESLAPDLVIANREENRKRDVRILEAAGLRVFVTYARTVDEAVREIVQLGSIVARDEQATEIVERIALAREKVRARPSGARPRVAALIWKQPYMAIGPDSFANDLLAECGASNPFARAGRRYPHVEIHELEAARPDVILLPTEPYEFREADRRELLALDCPAAREARIHIIEGELLTWYGPRIARALFELSERIHCARPG